MTANIAAFDVSSTLAFDIGIDIFAICVLMVVYRGTKDGFADTYENRLLRNSEFAMMLLLVTDIFMWLLNGRGGSFLRILSYIDNCSYYVLQIFVALEWLRYSYHRTYRKNMAPHLERALVLIPFVLMCVIVIASPWTGWCFYLDDASVYHRGPLSMPLSGVVMAYLASASIMALRQHSREALPDRRKELLLISLFPVLPLAGGTVQMLSYGLSIVWPCAVLAALIIYVNMGSRAISRDPLTGLNNRGTLDRYLQSHLDAGQDDQIAAIMMDIDHFKQINDHYGHDVGDEALIQAARLLRALFQGSPALLARYGGDEFMVVLPGADEAEAEETVAQIREAFEAFDRIGDAQYKLSPSIGYALSGVPERQRTEEDVHRAILDLIRAADESMYRDKQVRTSPTR